MNAPTQFNEHHAIFGFLAATAVCGVLFLVEQTRMQTLLQLKQHQDEAARLADRSKLQRPPKSKKKKKAPPTPLAAEPAYPTQN